MHNILLRAWRDTCRSYGRSPQEIARKVFAAVGTAVGTLGILYLKFGDDVATSEAWVFAATIVGGAIGTFVPAFLLNLWLAPYRIVHDQLDKIAAAQPTNPVVIEAAQERSRQTQKKNDALREMKILRGCIYARVMRSYEGPHRSDHIEKFDHQFLTLTEKYGEWLPSDIADHDKVPWVDRIIATLEVYEYPAANDRIKQAVSAGTWKAEAE